MSKRKRGNAEVPPAASETEAAAADAGSNVAQPAAAGANADEPAAGGGQAVVQGGDPSAAVAPKDGVDQGSENGVLGDGQAAQAASVGSENSTASGAGDPHQQPALGDAGAADAGGADGAGTDGGAAAAADAGLGDTDAGLHHAASGFNGQPDGLPAPSVEPAADTQTQQMPDPLTVASWAAANAFIGAVNVLDFAEEHYEVGQDAAVIQEARAFIQANRDAPGAAIPTHLALKKMAGGAMNPSPLQVMLWTVFRCVFLLVFDYLEGERLAAEARPAEPEPFAPVGLGTR